jgi:NAD(P)H-quinone oxidoreductase subunit 4L
MIMMGVELMLGGAMVNLVAFWRFLHPEVYSGQMFVLIVMTVMALEMAVGFGVGTGRFRAKGSVEMEEAQDLKG